MYMNKRLHYAELIKKLISCENRVQLSDVVKEINEFNKNYFISQNSEEFKKFETVIGLMKIKLRHKHGITESKNYLISENQLKFIVENNRMDTLVSQYLNSQDWYTWDIGDGEFNVTDGYEGKTKFRFRIVSSSTVPDLSFDTIYINDSVITQIMKLFGMESNDATKSIINWFNKKYNKNLTIEDFEWMDQYDDDDTVYQDEY